MQDNVLLHYESEGKKQIWIGRKPPLDMPTADMAASAGFRLSNIHHHSYDTVWAYETMLDDLGQKGWKLALDEMIRLLKEEGRLIMRMRKDGRPSYVQVKGFLGRHMGVEVSVEYEWYHKPSGVWTAVFSIRRLDFAQYLRKDWTFAILTLGNKPDNVVRFLQSVREYEPDGTSEIIVVGPHDARYDAFGVKYIELDQFRDDDYAEIGKKKNAVIQAASGTNLLIAHDRFALGPGFFKGFEKYGYDFDFSTVSQYDENGKEMPAYGAINGHLWSTSMIWVREYRNLYPHQYVCGGLTVFKTATVRKIGYNSLLMWDQMEDVELTDVFVERGFVPRVNFISDALVLETRPGFFESFRAEEEGFAPPPLVGGADHTDFSSISRVASRLPKWMKNNWLYRKLKQIYWRSRA